MHGGAIKFQDGARLTMINNMFTNNSVKVVDPVNIQSAKLQQRGKGGAINFDCNNVAFKLQRNCDVNL